MPVGLKQFGGCVLEGKVYLVGGVLEHDTGYVSDHSPRPSNQGIQQMMDFVFKMMDFVF